MRDNGRYRKDLLENNTGKSTTHIMKLDRVFLDESILFSIAQAENGLSQLWELVNKGQCLLLTSQYVIEKAKRNLRCSDHLRKLEKRLPIIDVVLEADSRMRCPVELPKKIRAVLMAAISAKADYFLTGDTENYGKYRGQTIMGVKILTARDYLQKEKTGTEGRSIQWKETAIQ